MTLLSHLTNVFNLLDTDDLIWHDYELCLCHLTQGLKLCRVIRLK